MFGHPALINVPNQVTGHQLAQILEPLIPAVCLLSPSAAIQSGSGTIPPHGATYYGKSAKGYVESVQTR